ncbi:MAG: Tim44 domain-containing protein [Sphingomonadales bacterium]|nr:MAG: Tim44 domain-containing protein [Sphingomonadales bacterium]TNF03633.1 MAG: Tim44 domain-containing protein [Sphingomonadales bacterium]
MYMIVILALVAAFLALRLYSVLGRRTGHEQQPAPQKPEERAAAGVMQPRMPQRPLSPDHVPAAGDMLIAPEAESGMRAIIGADRHFDVPQFLDGARSAYGMILDAFWNGKREDLGWLCDADVARSFEQAIDDREAQGHVLENRLVRIDKAQIVDAALRSGTASITVQFDADIAAVTRDRDGNVIAGSMSDAVTTHDIWTFTRQIGQADPNWKLSETDEAA